MDCILSMHGMALECNCEVWNMYAIATSLKSLCGSVDNGLINLLKKSIFQLNILSPIFTIRILMGMEQSIGEWSTNQDPHH